MSGEQVSTPAPLRSGQLGAAALGVDLLRETVVPSVRSVHEAVASRVPFARLQRPVASAVYRGIDGTLSAASIGLQVGDRVLDRTGLGAPLEAGPRGRMALAALSGLVGDRLPDQHPGLAITMAPRVAGHDVTVTSEGLRSAYPDAAGEVVVLLHGLGESEESWQVHAAERTPYAERLAADLGWTPVLLRANTGLPVRENGVALASLLDRLVHHWPVPATRIALIGHSMGGLIIRAAAAVAGPRQAGPSAEGRDWTELVTDVVTLGTPHLGAPLARGVAVAAKALALLPESAGLGELLDHRSAGIGDLRDGLAPDLVGLDRARYHLVAATVSAGPRAPVGGLLGDGLVRYGSATATRRGRCQVHGADVLHVPGAHHFDLLNHPDVHAALHEWLALPDPRRTR